MAATLPPVGARFVMTETVEVKERGVILSRYRTDQSYTCTDGNQAQLAEWLAEGKAALTIGKAAVRPVDRSDAGDASSGPGRLSGTAKT